MLFRENKDGTITQLPLMPLLESIHSKEELEEVSKGMQEIVKLKQDANQDLEAPKGEGE